MKKNCILYFAILIIALTGCGAKKEAEPDVFLKVYQPVTQYEETFSETDLNELLKKTSALAGINTMESEEISYFYQRGTDYEYDEAEHKFEILDYSKKVHSAGLLLKEDLHAGRLPESLYEIVVHSTDESLIGKTLRVCFQKENTVNKDECVYFDFTISGIQTALEENIYFSNAFCVMMIRGLLEYDRDGVCWNVALGDASEKGLVDAPVDFVLLTYGYYNVGINAYFPLFLDEGLKGAEVVTNSKLFDAYGAVYREMMLRYETKPDEEKAQNYADSLAEANIGPGEVFYSQDEIGLFCYWRVKTHEFDHYNMERILVLKDETKIMGDYPLLFVSPEIYKEIYWKEYSGENIMIRVKKQDLEAVKKILKDAKYGMKQIEEGEEG